MNPPRRTFIPSAGDDAHIVPHTRHPQQCPRRAGCPPPRRPTPAAPSCSASVGGGVPDAPFAPPPMSRAGAGFYPARPMRPVPCHCEPARTPAWRSAPHNKTRAPLPPEGRPYHKLFDLSYFFALLSTTSRSSAVNSSMDMAPRSPSARWRGDTVPFSMSRSPTTTM